MSTDETETVPTEEQIREGLPVLKVERFGEDLRQVLTVRPDGIEEAPARRRANKSTGSRARKAREDRRPKGREHDLEDGAPVRGSTLYPDPFEPYYGLDPLDALEPPVDVDRLNEVPELSDILEPCLTAYARGVAGHGWQIVERDGLAELDNYETLKEERKAERRRLRRLLTYLNPRESFGVLRQKDRRAREALGYSALEVVRDREGNVVNLYRIPGALFRLCPTDDEAVTWEQPIFDEDSLEWTTRPIPMRFGRGMHFPLGDQARRVYLKEFGDPRTMNRHTGRFGTDEPTAGTDDRPFVPPEARANEFLYFPINDTRSRYGLPRWIGVILAILTNNRADSVNYDFFDNKGIPPLVVLVSGGMLTQSSAEAIKKHFAKIQGIERFHAPLVIEAEAAESEMEAMDGVAGRSTVRIEIKPLQEFIQDDATFREGIAQNRKRVRAMFGLTPMDTGESDDFSRAAAMAAMIQTDRTIFRALRDESDVELFDLRLLPAWRVRFHRVRLNGPSMVHDEQAIDLLKVGSENLAITVGEVRAFLASRFGIELPPLSAALSDLPAALFNAGHRSMEEAVAKPKPQPMPPELGGTKDEGGDGKDEAEAEAEENPEEALKAAAPGVLALASRLYDLRRHLDAAAIEAIEAIEG